MYTYIYIHIYLDRYINMQYGHTFMSIQCTISVVLKTNRFECSIQRGHYHEEPSKTQVVRKTD